MTIRPLVIPARALARGSEFTVCGGRRSLARVPRRVVRRRGGPPLGSARAQGWPWLTRRLALQELCKTVQASFVTPGIGIGDTASGPNSYLGGLMSSFELRIISGVMTDPV